MSEIQDKKDLKYTIKKYVTQDLREEILKKLNISRSTYSLKEKALIGEKQGFELCETFQIANILNRDIYELLTTEAIEFYTTKTLR